MMALTALYIGLAFFVDDVRWLYFVTFFTIVAGWWCWQRAITRAKRKSSCGAWFFGVCLTVISCFFLYGVFSYFAGRPKFIIMLTGLGVSRQYLDARYRFEYHVRCADGDNTPFILLCHYPNNAAVSCMAMLLGPPPGAYTGPYPSFDEAVRLLATSGTPVELSSPPFVSFRVAGRKITLNLKQGRFSLGMMARMAREGKLIGLILDGRCAIFGINDGQPIRDVFYVDALQQRFLAELHGP